MNSTLRISCKVPLLAFFVILSGCNTPPRQAIMTGGGAAGGSAIGGAIDDSVLGYSTGALVGGVAGIMSSNYLDNRDATAEQAAYERGRRDQSIDDMNDLWASRVNPSDRSSIQANSKPESAGVYNGVRYLPRPPQTNPYELYDPAR